jgi:hypothetical protein
MNGTESTFVRNSASVETYVWHQPLFSNFGPDSVAIRWRAQDCSHVGPLHGRSRIIGMLASKRKSDLLLAQLGVL